MKLTELFGVVGAVAIQSWAVSSYLYVPNPLLSKVFQPLVENFGRNNWKGEKCPDLIQRPPGILYDICGMGLGNGTPRLDRCLGSYADGFPSGFNVG